MRKPVHPKKGLNGEWGRRCRDCPLNTLHGRSQDTFPPFNFVEEELNFLLLYCDCAWYQNITLYAAPEPCTYIFIL